jgi:ribonuclease R-like protein
MSMLNRFGLSVRPESEAMIATLLELGGYATPAMVTAPKRLFRMVAFGASRRTQYDEDRKAVDGLIQLADKHRVAIVLVHHLREMESDDPLDMIHGSAGLTGGVDSALVLKRRRGEADAYLYGDGRDYENPVELALEWNAITATWTILGGAEEYRMSEGRRAILDVLDNAEEPLGPKDITETVNAKGIEMNNGAVREMLSQMVKDGQVKNPSRGQYVHPDRDDYPDNADKLTIEGHEAS